MFINIIYELVLWVLASIAIPKMFFQKIFFGKYRTSFLQRFGKDFPQIPKNQNFTIWAHAVSLGETKAITPFLRLFKKQNKNCTLIISSITETGHAEAKKELAEADYHVYLPFDFRFKMSSILKDVKPDVVILSETDFWYNFLRFSKKMGAKIYLVNGKLSARSEKRFQWFSFLTYAIFEQFDHLFVQSKTYAKRFENIGVLQSKISSVGNLKIDGEVTYLQKEEIQKWQKLFKIEEGQKTIVIGSTHDPEEKQLLDVFSKIWKIYPTLKIILVPRHAERFQLVANLLAEKNISFVRYSKIGEATGDEQVILIDAMGLLKTCYQLSDIAIVAGSYTSKVGGHNILEPSFYGKPVIYGPYLHGQPDLRAIMEEYQAGRQVPIDELEAVLKDWITHPDIAASIGQRGLDMLKNQQGVVKKVWNAMQEDICKKTTHK